MSERQCAVCGATFEPACANARYCGYRCRKASVYAKARAETMVESAAHSAAFESWMDARCAGSHGWEATEALHADYVAFCKERGAPTRSIQDFGRLLSATGWLKPRKISQTRRQAWIGIKLREATR